MVPVWRSGIVIISGAVISGLSVPRRDYTARHGKGRLPGKSDVESAARSVTHVEGRCDVRGAVVLAGYRNRVVARSGGTVLGAKG